MRYNRNLLSALGLGLLVAVLAVPTTSAQSGDDEAYGDDYAAGDYGRVRYQINGLTVVRAESGAASKADLNSPIYPGDIAQTREDQRAEIQLGGGSIVWVDRGSEVTFLALPDPYASIKDNTILQLAAGSLGLTALLANNEEFRIDTPAATVFLLGDGDFRVEVLAGERVRVTSRRGVAEVVGAGGSVLVRGGTRTEVYPDATPARPEPFNTFTSNNFDRWIDDRQDQYRADTRYLDEGSAGDAYDSLPDEVRPYYAELSTSGTWTRTDEYGYVWSPGSVPRGWRPYRQGYWDYGPRGYFWVSHEPWGWAPYHYGRWVHTGGLGWSWIPGRVFGGAWVAWSWGSSYIGWAPLDYWNRPVYYGARHYGVYDPYCWSFVSYTSLHHGHHGYYGYRHYASVYDIGDPLRHHAIVTRPARVAPTRLAESAQARERALTEVRENRSVVVSDTRPSRSFDQVEGRLGGKPPVTRSKSEGRGGSEVAPNRGSRPPVVQPRSREGTDRPGRSMPSYEPRLSTGKPTREARPTVRPEQKNYRLPERDTRGSRQQPADTRSRETGTRRPADPRAIYERMATPRTTRERARSSWGSRRSPTAAPSRSAPPTPRAAPARTPDRPQAAPSRRAPSRPKASPAPSKPSKPRAAPSRSAPSRQKPAPPKSKPSGRSSKSRGR